MPLPRRRSTNLSNEKNGPAGGDLQPHHMTPATATAIYKAETLTEETVSALVKEIREGFADLREQITVMVGKQGVMEERIGQQSREIHGLKEALFGRGGSTGSSIETRLALAEQKAEFNRIILIGTVSAVALQMLAFVGAVAWFVFQRVVGA